MYDPSFYEFMSGLSFDRQISFVVGIPSLQVSTLYSLLFSDFECIVNLYKKTLTVHISSYRKSDRDINQTRSSTLTYLNTT